MGGSFGTLTAGLYMGGASGPGTSIFAETYEYDGTNWTAGADLGTAVYSQGGSGTQTAGMLIGGWNGSSNTTTTNVYDGTTWVTNPSLANTTSGNSTATSAPPSTALTQYGSDPNGTEEFSSAVTTRSVDVS